MAHLYWSLNITAVSGSAIDCVIKELIMRSTHGGTNLCVGGTASATSYTTGFPSSNAFDGDIDSAWISDTPFASPQRLSYQFASPVDVVQYQIYTTYFTDEIPISWTLEYSDDGTSWTTLHTVTSHTWLDTNATFTLPYDAVVAQNNGLNTVNSVNVTKSITIAVTQNNGINTNQPIKLTTVQTASVAQNNSATQCYSVSGTVRSNAVVQHNDSSNHNLSVIADSVRHAVIGINNSQSENNPLFIMQSVFASVGINNGLNESYLLNSKYLGVTYSTENRSITTFSSFNFDGGCVFNGKTLFFNSTGIFEHGGDTDNGSAISPSIKTGFMDVVSGQTGLISTHKMKRIPKSKVLVMANKNSGNINLNVTADTNTYSYSNSVQQTGFATFNIDIGRGIKYNKLQLELVANGCTSLDIESVSYNPIEVVRSQR